MPPLIAFILIKKRRPHECELTFGAEAYSTRRHPRKLSIRAVAKVAPGESVGERARAREREKGRGRERPVPLPMTSPSSRLSRLISTGLCVIAVFFIDCRRRASCGAKLCRVILPPVVIELYEELESARPKARRVGQMNTFSVV